MKHMFRAIAVLALIVFTSPYVMAGVLGVPNTFTNGSTANADDVNANFNAVETEVNDNNSRIILNSNGITSNTTETSANADDISANTATIGANTATIGANTGDITINKGAIDANSIDITINKDNIGSIQGKITASCPDGKSIRAFLSLGVDCVASPPGSDSVGQLQLKDGLAGANWDKLRGVIAITKFDKVEIASVTIQAPTTGGVLVVSASGQMNFGRAFKDVVRCALAPDTNGMIPSGGNIEWSWQSDKEQTPIVLNRAFSLTAPVVGPSTIFMVCDRENTSNVDDVLDFVNVVSADLTVIFVPVRYNPGNP